MASLAMLGYVRLFGLYFWVLMDRVCFVLSPYYLIFTEFCAFLWVGSAGKMGEWEFSGRVFFSWGYLRTS